MNRRILLACVPVCLAVTALWLLIGGIAEASDLPSVPWSACNLSSASGAVLTPSLHLGETITPTPVFTTDVSEDVTQTLMLSVTNKLEATAPITVTAELSQVLSSAGESVLDKASLSPGSQAVTAQGEVTFTLSLAEQPSETTSYSVTLRLSSADTEPATETIQEFVWQISVLTERAEAVLTPTLRLSGPNCETLLSSRPVYRVVVSDERWAPVSLHVCNLAEEQVTVVPRLLNISLPTGEEAVPAMLAISPVSQTVARNGVVTFTLDLIEGWLPEGTYPSTLELSAVSTETMAVEQEFKLLVTPWPAQLEWAQQEFVYVADAEHGAGTVRVVARYANAENPHAEVTVLARKGVTEQVTFSTAGFLSISRTEVLTEDEAIALTLNFTATQLPEPGDYEGTLRLSASNAAAITKTFTLVVPEDRARGSYKIAYAELGRTPELTPSLPLTTALQFTGVRWLPGSTRVAGGWWPAAIGALLLGVGVAVLAGYTAWALAVSKPKDKKTENKKSESVLQKVLAWIRKYRWVSLGIGVGVVVLIVVCAPNPWFKLTQATVGERKLLVWETEMRAPVRDVKVQPGEVVNETGDTGEIIIGRHNGEIEARDILTVTDIDIQGLSQPGVYQGRILIQSPDIAGGVVEVPVQATVHDFICWPALVILLGVVLGGWAKYHQETVSERLKQRKALQEAWEAWDEYLGTDSYRETKVGRINPLYTRIRTRIDIAQRLLQSEPEWGIEEAKETVTDVGNELNRYKALGGKLARLEANLKALDASTQQDEDIFQRARAILSLFNKDEILKQHKEEIRQLLGKQGIDTSQWSGQDQKLLKEHPEKIEELLGRNNVDTSKWSDEEKALLKKAGELGKLEELEEKVLAVPTSFLELRKHVDEQKGPLEEELRGGKLPEAERSWHREFVVRLKPELDELNSEVTHWESKSLELKARLGQAKEHLQEVAKRLEQVAETPEEYANAWGLLIQAQAEFQAMIAKAVADEVKPFLPAERVEGLVETPWTLYGIPVPPTLPTPGGAEIRVAEPKPYRWENIEWDDAKKGEVRCNLTFQVSGFDRQSQPNLYAYQVEPELIKDVKLIGDQPVWQQAERSWKSQIRFTMPEEAWHGEPRKYRVVVNRGGYQEEEAFIFIEVRSQYTIELPLGKVREGEWLFCEATFMGKEEDREEHKYFRWKFNCNPFNREAEGSLKVEGEIPSGVHFIQPDESSKTSKSARIELLLYQGEAEAGRNRPIQKALLEGRVQEWAMTGLYQDKRRHNFNRRVAALLLALVAGIGAKRVFGLTFGSFEEYLGAFAWGVGFSLGIDPAANGYQGIKEWVQTDLLKIKGKVKKTTEEGKSEQPGKPNE